MSTILVVDEYVPSQRVVLARNPNYYETDAEGTRPPYVDEVVFQIISDQDTMLQSFIAGNLSFLPLRSEDAAGLEEPQLTWLQNNTFRTAMAHLVDRETIINNIAFGFGSPQYSFVPRMSPYYWDGADEAWRTADFTTDEEQRKEGWQTLHGIWIEELPWVFTYNAAMMHGYVNELGNIYPHPIEDYDWEGILHRVYIAE